MVLPRAADPAVPSTAGLALDVLTCAHLDAAALAARQERRLRRLLRGAAEGSAFYRRHWQGIDLDRASLQDLPPVSKRELMAHFDGWVTDPAVTVPALRDFMADPDRAGQSFLGRYTVWESSGSSGEPALFVQDETAMAVYDCLEATRRQSPRPWLRWWDPMLLSERIAFVGALGGHFASRVSSRRLRRLYPWLAGAWRSFSILQPTASLVAELDAFAPSIVATYPTAAVMLAEQARRGVLHARPQEVWTGGETLTPAMRRRIERGLGAAVRNSYGASEFLPIAWECGHGRLHVNADWVILEPVDAQGRTVPPGRLSHSTLLTNLANAVQPLVRYDLGDEVRWLPDGCPCGSPLPTIEVCGRRDDALQLRADDGHRVTLLPLALTTLLEDEAGAFDFELRQTGDAALCLSLGPSAERTREDCRRVLQRFAHEQGVEHLRLTVRRAPPALGRSGKHPRIVGSAARKGVRLS